MGLNGAYLMLCACPAPAAGSRGYWTLKHLDMHWPGHHKTSQNSYLDIIGQQEDQLGICFILIYFTYGKLSPKIDQYISISLNRRKNNMQRVTCKSLESSHEQQWAGWWRRSVAGAAIAWTAVCAAFSAKRARSEILFMSSCHSNSFYAWKIFPEMSKMRSLRWSWCMVAVSQNTTSQPESQHIKAPATETTGIIPRIRRP